MKYHTQNEFDHFEFHEVHISDLQLTDGFFHMVLDDVIILPENSCNRDIRKMRCNDMLFKIQDGSMTSFVEEGCKIYDADGKLREEKPDRMLDVAEYREVVQVLVDGTAYEITREQVAEKQFQYRLIVDGTDEKTYAITVQGSGDSQEWDRFLNIEV